MKANKETKLITKYEALSQWELEFSVKSKGRNYLKY